MGHSGGDIGRQLRLPRHLIAVDHHAAKAFAFPVHPDADMAHEALSGGLIVGGDLVAAHPLPHRLGGAVGGLRLDQTAADGHNLVGPSLKKADGTVSPHGVLALVAGMLRIFRPQNFLHSQIQPADAGQSVLHPLALGPQLLRIGEVTVGAAAALPGIGALRLHAFGRRIMDLYDLTGAGSFHHLGDPEVDLLPPDGVGHEHHRPVYSGDPQPLAGIAVNNGCINTAFFQCFHGFYPFYPHLDSDDSQFRGGRENRVCGSLFGFPASLRSLCLRAYKS